MLASPPSISIPRCTAPPALTAAEFDPHWKTAAPIGELTMSLGEDATGLQPIPTRVLLQWDPSNLYVRFECQDDDFYCPVKGRDAELYRGDAVEVFLDVVGDGRQYFEIQANSNDDLFDQLITITAPVIIQGPHGRLDDLIVQRDFWPVPEWNMPGLRWKGKRSTHGWIVDMAMPAASALHRTGQTEFRVNDSLGAHFMRYDYPLGNPRRLLAMNWAPVAYGCPHISPAAMGTVHLVENLSKL
jgi:hypothetical protein